MKMGAGMKEFSFALFAFADLKKKACFSLEKHFCYLFAFFFMEKEYGMLYTTN